VESGPGVPGGRYGTVNELGTVVEANEALCPAGDAGAIGVIGAISIGAIVIVGIVEMMGVLEGVVEMLLIIIGKVIGVACIVLMFASFKI